MLLTVPDRRPFLARVPQLYGRRHDGLLYTVPMTSTHYYFSNGQGDLYSLPLGLQIFTGMDRMHWYCLSTGFETTQRYDTIPPRINSAGDRCLRIQSRVTLPSCWDGVRLSSTDQSHVGYQVRSRCPAATPFRIPEIRSVYSWHLDTSQPHDYVLSTGDATGSDMHSDFVSGWPEDRLPGFLAKCVKGEGPGCSASPNFPGHIDERLPVSLTFETSPPWEKIEGIRSPLVGCVLRLCAIVMSDLH